MSQGEQAGVDPHDAEVQRRLAEGNAAYEERFDRIYLVRAAGRSAEEILALLEQRLTNDPDTELAVTAGQLREIAVLRLEGLLDMTTLSTHVLDAALGVPAAALAVTLFDPQGRQMTAARTDADGRVAFDLELGAGTHVLHFDTGAYFFAADRDTFYPEVAVVLRGRPRAVAPPRGAAAQPVLLHDLQGELMTGKIVLGPNQYGKAEVRLVKITRDTERHVIEDLNVTSQLRGDFEACHTEGDNSQVVATDTQKNTVYAFARDGVGSPEDFLLAARAALHRRVRVGHRRSLGGGAVRVGTHRRRRSLVRAHRAGRPGPTVVEMDGDQVTVTAGLKDCTVLNSTDSEFHGFPRDRYTTLQETTDRILATSVTATWRYTSAEGIDFNATYDAVRDLLLTTFASTYSYALQQTIFEMGKAVLEAHDEVAEISLSCPNKHHFLVDLEPFGLDNPGEVFFAADRPYGLIEATVLREGA